MKQMYHSTPLAHTQLSFTGGALWLAAGIAFSAAPAAALALAARAPPRAPAGFGAARGDVCGEARGDGVLPAVRADGELLDMRLSSSGDGDAIARRARIARR